MNKQLRSVTYVYYHLPKGYQPFGSVVVGDIENTDSIKVERKTVLYAANGIAVQNATPKEWAIQIGVPTTCYGDTGIHPNILWYNVETEGRPTSQELLCTLYMWMCTTYASTESCRAVLFLQHLSKTSH